MVQTFDLSDILDRSADSLGLSALFTLPFSAAFLRLAVLDFCVRSFLGEVIAGESSAPASVYQSRHYMSLK